MGVSQLELEKNRIKYKEKFATVLPDLEKAFGHIREEVYKEGALSLKMKRLMSLAVALRAECQNCITSQASLALEAGATVEEILETCAVVVSMSGTTGIAETLKVIQLLEEMGKL